MPLNRVKPRKPLVSNHRKDYYLKWKGNLQLKKISLLLHRNTSLLFSNVKSSYLFNKSPKSKLLLLLSSLSNYLHWKSKSLKWLSWSTTTWFVLAARTITELSVSCTSVFCVMTLTSAKIVRGWWTMPTLWFRSKKLERLWRNNRLRRSTWRLCLNNRKKKDLWYLLVIMCPLFLKKKLKDTSIRQKTILRKGMREVEKL